MGHVKGIKLTDRVGQDFFGEIGIPLILLLYGIINMVRRTLARFVCT